jgi:glucose/arabinose dehydrogenase
MGLANAQECEMPGVTDFEIVPLNNLNLYSDMAIFRDGRVLQIHQWNGDVALYTPGVGTEIIARVPTNAGRRIEDGMLGIELDLNFEETGWIYVYHTPAELGSNRLTRYTFLDDQLLNPKIILEVPRTISGDDKDQRHAGGGMDWNPKTGNLWLCTGDDTNPINSINVGYGPRTSDIAIDNALRTAGNTNDLRGKVLRIKPLPFGDEEEPEPGPGSTYEIPEGNLFPPGAFPGGKTRPEIYSMGHRNPYRVMVDPLTGWAWVGEIGPDGPNIDDPAKGVRGHDEVNLIKGPGNFGWPFAIADNQPYIKGEFESSVYPETGAPFDLENLQNLSQFNTGLIDLPPARPALVYYSADGQQTGLSRILGNGSESATMGPVYNYDPGLESDAKFPPYFHRKAIFGEWARQQIWVITVDKEGTLTKIEPFMDRNHGVGSPIDIEFGPDGSLYVLEYTGCGYCNRSGKLYKIIYTGPQYDPALCPQVTMGCMLPEYTEYDATANMDDGSCLTVAVDREISASIKGLFKINANTIHVTYSDEFLIDILSVKGEKMFSLKGKGLGKYTVTGITDSGLYLLRVKTAEKTFSTQLFLLQ